MKDKTLENELYLYGLIFLVVGTICFLAYVFFAYPYLKNIECIFYHMIGCYCPGCGGTRAVIALLHGKFLTSLWYHPIVIYSGTVYGVFMLSHTFEKFHLFGIKGIKFHNWYLTVGVLILAGNWIFKNILLLGFQIKM